MASRSRRNFLRTATASVGATAASMMFPDLIRKAMAIPANNKTRSIMDVEHVVIFTQENRSFDHYLGMLNGVRGLSDPRAVRLPNGKPVYYQATGSEHPDGYVLPFHGDSTVTKAYTVGGSDMSHQSDLTLVHRGKHDQWGTTGELKKRMAYYTASDLPFYYALANAFTVCDHYHCSTLTQTNPNRLHLWTGCNGGGKVGGDPDMNNSGAAVRYPWKTYPERLQDKNKDFNWKVYQEADNFDDNMLELFKNFQGLTASDPLAVKGLTRLSTGASTGDYIVAAFRKDLEQKTLPAVSWIVTAADLSEHPNAEPAKGENVCAKLIAALVDNPDMFAKTVFIVNYDENGGFFDHMPPPLPPLNATDGYSSVPVDGEFKDYGSSGANPGKQPVGLGIRVPVIVVSPWSRGGWVCSEIFDHTSTLRFLETRFGIAEENISDWRRTVCGDMTSAFDFETPNLGLDSLSLPSTADYLDRVNRSAQGVSLTIPAKQSAPSQSALQRRARGLPYEFHANGRVDAASGKFIVDIANTGAAGTSFYVYDNTDAQGPWRYALGSGKSHAAAQWHAGTTPLSRYDLTLQGPNGFYRQFKGSLGTPAAAPIEVTACYEVSQGDVTLKFRNSGSAACTVTVRQADAYALAPGQQRTHTSVVQPGETVSDEWLLSASDHWYDLSITVDVDASFLRRYAGCVETGKPTRTDPAIGKAIY